MISDRALYTLAVGVLAVGIAHQYSHQGRELVQCTRDQVQRLANDTVATVYRAGSGNSGHFTLKARDTDARVQVAMARAQARIDCAQASIARRNAAIARLQAAIEKVNAKTAGIDVRVDVK